MKKYDVMFSQNDHGTLGPGVVFFINQASASLVFFP